MKDANLFSSDCVQNFKTVTGLANDRQLVYNYKRLLRSTQNLPKVQLVGLFFGMSQFIQFAVIGSLFYAGAYFHIEYGGQAQDILIAIFSMIFGAMACG